MPVRDAGHAVLRLGRTEQPFPTEGFRPIMGPAEPIRDRCPIVPRAPRVILPSKSVIFNWGPLSEESPLAPPTTA